MQNPEQIKVLGPTTEMIIVTKSSLFFLDITYPFSNISSVYHSTAVAFSVPKQGHSQRVRTWWLEYTA